MARSFWAIVGVLVVALAAAAGAGSGLRAPAQVIVFSSARAENAQPEVYALRLGERRTNVSRFLGPDSAPAWSPDGRRIAFVRSSASVWVANRDGSRQRRLAAPSAGFLREELSWSRDGRWIAVAVGGRGGPPQGGGVYLLSSDGSRSRQIVADPFVTAAAWSPDGRRIAYVSFGDPTKLVVVDAQGMGAHTIATGTFNGLTWSRDGRSFAYTSGDGEVFVVAASGGTPRLVSDPDRHPSRPSWAPGGRQLVFSEGDTIWIADVDGVRRRILTTGRDPSWSPNGRWIAFVRGSNPERVYLIRPDGRGLRRLTDDRPSTRILLPGPRWSPRSDAVVFANQSSPPLNLYSIRPDGSGLSRLTRDTANHLRPRLAPNGSAIAYVRDAFVGALTTGAWQDSVWTSNADGSGARLVAESAGDPSWAPDGRRLAFTRFEAGKPCSDFPGHLPCASEIVVAARTGSDAIAAAKGSDPAWSPDGASIAFVGPGDAGELRLVRPDGTGERALVDVAAARATSTALQNVNLRYFSFAAPAWSSDGRSLAVTLVYSDARTHPQAVLFLVASDGSNLRRAPWQLGYVFMQGGVAPPAWSPDAAQVALGAGVIEIGPARGGTMRTLTSRYFQSRDPDWGPRR